jgi:phosphoribosyl 1,2-cyclic phosphate 1,2-diphosphodiesterase
MKDLAKESIKLDLHVHSTFSDGSMSVDELFKLAFQMGISHLAITDHDTLEGFSEIIKIGEKYQICAISGVELSAFSYKIHRKVHILAYGLPMKAPSVYKLCQVVLERRTQNSLRQIVILQRNGYKISIEEVQKVAGISTALYKQHIMEVLVKKGYTQDVLSPLYTDLFKGNGIAAGDIE